MKKLFSVFAILSLVFYPIRPSFAGILVGGVDQGSTWTNGATVTNTSITTDADPVPTSITNNGTIQRNDGGNGIYLSSTNLGTLNNTATGVINTAYISVYVNNATFGSLANAGTITSATSDGTIYVSSSVNFGGLNNTGTIANTGAGPTFYFWGSPGNALQNDGTIENTGTGVCIKLNGSQALNFTNNDTISSAASDAVQTGNSSTLTFVNAGTITAANYVFNLSSGATITNNASGSISGTAGAINHATGGALSIINSGTIEGGISSAVAAAHSFSQTAGSVTGNIYLTGASAKTFSVDGGTITGNVDLGNSAGHTVNLTAGDITGSFDMGDTAGGTITVDPAGGQIMTLGGTIVGTTLAVNMTGAGTLVLSGASAYTGTTTLTGGTLQVGVASVGSVGSITSSAIGKGGVTFNGGGMSSDGATARTILNAVSFTGNATLGDGVNTGKLTFSAAADLGGAVRTLTVASDVEVGGVISNGGLTKAGAGTLILSGANTYASATTINAGTVQISGSTDRLPTTTAVTLADALGATLDLNDLNQTIGSLAGGGTNGGNVTLGSAKLTVGNVSDTTYAGVISDASGQLTKTGTGSLTLSGANTYTGATIISTGTLKLGSAAGLGSTVGDTTVSGGNVAALDLNGQTVGAEAVTLNSTGISSSGALYNSSATAASLSGAIALASDSTITSSGAGGLTLSGGINMGVNWLTINGANDTTVSGAITGTGKLIKEQGGTLVLSDANTYTGATTISAGTLQIGNGGATGKLDATGGIVDDATLEINRTGTVTQSTDLGTISGGGVVNLTSSGTTVFDLANTYTGATNVNAGTLIVDGSIATSSLITVQTAGTLSGAGTTGVLMIASGGTISPGASPGKLTSVGATTYAGGGTYIWEINDATGTVGTDPGWDLHDITGGAGGLTVSATSANKFTIDIASLTAGNVSGDAVNFDKKTNYTWTITQTTTGVTGFSADAFTLDASNFTNDISGAVQNGYFDIRLSGNDLELLYYAAMDQANLAPVATDGNGLAVANVLDGIVNPTGDMATVLSTLQGLSSSEVGTALDTMTPDVSSGTANASRDLTGNFLSTVTNRLGVVRGGTGIATGDVLNATGIWVQGLGSHMKQDERKGIEGYQANIFGTTIGADKLIDNHVRLGVAGGYGFADVNSKQPGSPSDGINSYSAILYGSFDSLNLCEARKEGKNSRVAVRSQDKNHWYVDGMTAFTQNNYDSRREIWLTPATKRVAKADHGAQQYTTSFEGGYTFVTEKTKALEITPFASLGYSYLYMNKYKEKGADALDLTVQGEGYHELQQGLGTKLAYPIVSKKVGTFIPSARAAWLYDYIGDQFETTASFAGGGASFETKGAKPARNGLLLGGEIAFLNKGNMTVTGNYDLQLKNQFMSNTYYGTVRYDF